MHHIFYHANCADGFAAACIARQALISRGEHPDTLRFYPINYQDTLQSPIGHSGVISYDQVTYLDYTPPKLVIDTLSTIYDGTVKLTIIDHHEKAAPLHGYTQAPEPGGIWQRTTKPPFESVFRFTQSGAGLAFNHYFPEGWKGWQGENFTPYAVTLIEFRDLGYAFNQPENPVSIDAFNLHAYLFRCIPRTFEAWEHVLGFNQNSLRAHQCDIGARLRAADSCIIAAAVNACHWLDFSHAITGEGFATHMARYNCSRIPAVNGLDAGLISDACQALLKAYPSAPFAASWYVCPTTGKAVYSLRSRDKDHPDGHVNVSEIAAAMAPGGGGHPCAAGFSTTTPIPLAS